MSSRIPDGVQNHCPLCKADARIDGQGGFGESACPECKAGLWYIKGDGGAKLYDAKDVNAIRERIAQILNEKLGTNPDSVTYGAGFIQDLGADSLDIVELVMELEEAFGVTIPDDQAEKLKTVGDAVTYILEHKPAG